MKKIILITSLSIVVVFAAIQLVPFGRDHTDPPVVSEPKWDSPQTRELADRACFDCHSNQTRWPWYSNVAPVSWLVQNDVIEGRRALNFSDWARVRGEPDEIPNVIREGEMPPVYFTLLHPEASLSLQEKQDLVKGLVATLGLNTAAGDED